MAGHLCRIYVPNTSPHIGREVLIYRYLARADEGLLHHKTAHAVALICEFNLCVYFLDVGPILKMMMVLTDNTNGDDAGFKRHQRWG